MKVWNYVVIMVGILLGMHVLGISGTGATEVFNATGIQTNNSDADFGTFNSNIFSVSGFFNNLFSNTGALIGILVGLGAAAIAAGLTGGRYSVENFVLVPFITVTLVLFVQAFLGIINDAIATGQTWVAVIIVMLLTPFMVGFVVALAEFFRGTD